MLRRLWLCAFAFLLAVYLGGETFAQKKIKVACIGNSVTYGYLLPDRERNAYPSQLQQMLGEGYEVRNFGKNGATLLNKGHRPYTQQQEYKDALMFAADKVIIHLGLNDTDPRDWSNYSDFFIKDYLDLIASFRNVNPECEICRLSPIFDRHPRFKSGTRDWYADIQEAIGLVASYANVGLIDFQSILYNRPELFADALHPNAQGASILAKAVYSRLTGDYGGLQLPVIYTDKMVLQRDKPLKFSGRANAGDEVVVSINSIKKITYAGEDGKWNLVLSPFPAGGPYTLTISTKDTIVTFRNVLVGEVWLCSGQSNMAFILKRAITGKEDIIAADYPNLRFFDMKPRWDTRNEEWDTSVMDELNALHYYKETNWTECTSHSAAQFSAVAYYFGKILADSLKVPIGLIHNAIGGSPCEAWIDRRTLEYEYPDILENWKKNDRIQEWVRERAAKNITHGTNPLQRHPYEPCYLFESGIIPLAQYPVKGIIWYQGESNAPNLEVYEKLFPLLIDSWRANWENRSLPFYYVQLSTMDRPGWGKFRNSQRKMMNIIPNIYMAVSSDKGDSLDVHPRHKKEIGERLAAWALNKSYNKKVIPSGPLFRKAEGNGNLICLSFDYAEGMHASDGKELRSFEIAEKEGIYYPAHAVIENDKIKVWNDRVITPKLVRYGWKSFNRANLVNKAGFPASTFKAEIEQLTKPSDLSSRQMSTYYYQRSTLFEELPVGSKDIVFLGNSITDGCEWNELFNNPYIKNRGISGDIAEGILRRLEPIIKGKPAKIFLMIGVNDISRGLTADSIAGKIAKIVREMKIGTPKTKIYLQSVLPFDGEKGKFKSLAGRLPVAKELNRLLRTLATKEQITFIDLFLPFADENTEKISYKYTNDGLHLVGEGYLLWRDLIKKYVNE